jgi:hypothetical protein
MRRVIQAIAKDISAFQPDDVVSYMEMCSAIGVNLQRGMNFRFTCFTRGGSLSAR